MQADALPIPSRPRLELVSVGDVPDPGVHCLARCAPKQVPAPFFSVIWVIKVFIPNNPNNVALSLQKNAPRGS